MRPGLRCVAVLLGAALPLSTAAAQQLDRRFSSAAQERSGGAAFAIEAAGGMTGSALGFAVARAVFDQCETEDIVCELGAAAAVLGIATAASAAGVYLAGRLGDTDPSGVGAALGAIAGAAAGVGVWHLAKEELNLVSSDAASVAVYAVTQGLVAAAGSRLFRALRD